MAWPNTTGWATPDYTDATTGVLIRDVSPLLLEVLRRDQTLLGYFKTGKAATNRVVEWFERDWVPYQFSTDGDIATATALAEVEYTLNNTTGGPGYTEKFFQAGDLVQCVGTIDGTGKAWKEIMQVAATNTSTHTITVKRLYGGSTSMYVENGNANVTTNGLIFEKIGTALEENSSPGTDKSRGYGPAKKNYTQIFGYDLDVAGTALAMNLYNMNDFFGTNLRELTEELKLQLERTAIYGVARATGDDPEGTSTKVRTMNGIKAYLTETGGNEISTGYTTPTEELINALCRKIVLKNGQLNNRRGILACSPANAEIIGDLWKDKITITREDTTRGQQVKSIVTKLGFTLDIVWDPNIHNNDLMILNPSKIELVPLQGRAWFVKRYDNGKDGQSARVLGEWTTRIWDAKKDHAICTCLTTTGSVPA
jgi:hypothetical protein